MSCSAGSLTDGEVERLGAAWREMLGGLARQAGSPTAGGHTVSDFHLVDLGQDEIDSFEAIAAELGGERAS
jgi:hypothetical protein